LADGADDADVVVPVVRAVGAVGAGSAQDAGRANNPVSRTIRAPRMIIDLARRHWRRRSDPPVAALLPAGMIPRSLRSCPPE
jgi:hypothetical protein